MAKDTSQTPLAGIVTCCTSIEPERRSEFSAMISEMGGVNKLDLTSDVTHLIVGGYDTPKYKYVAKERTDVKCLLPEWLEALRESWIEGGETDVERLEQQYRLPTFHDLRVCVTGFQDLAMRKQLEQTVNNNGGQYRGDLTKEVTHLIAHVASGAKYLHAKQWGIHVITIEWLQQSLERGMILDEALYDPVMKEEDRGKGAWIRRSISTTSLKKRAREDINIASRKLRRTASARFGGQSDALWGDIVGGGFAPKETKKNEWDDVEEQNAFTTSPYERNDIPTLPDIPRPQSSSVKKPVAKKGLFQGKRFYLHGFDSKKSAVLQKHLHSHDADILPDLSQLSQPADSLIAPSSLYLLVPHTSSDSDLPSTPDPSAQTKIVNELWLEKCLHSKRYIEPDSNATYTPFRYPITGFDKLTISSTGFEDIELLHVGKTIRLLGATYAGTLTKNISALVCHDDASPNREKVQYALKWNIPVVKAEWLWDCMRSGQLKSLWDYLVHPETQSKPADPDNEDEDGDQDFHNPKRTNSGPRKKEHDYGKGPRTWLRRKSAGSGNEPSRPDSQEPPQKRTRPPLRAVEDSFSTPLETAEDSLTPMLDDPQPPSAPTLSAHPSALQEISPNSPPKPLAPLKPSSDPDSTPKPAPAPDALSTAISALLAARQREAAMPSAIDTSGTTPAVHGGRRKRTLFGRAGSNLSARSHLSRASSVDTLNTDGVGTPVETGSANAPLSAGSVSGVRDPLAEALVAEGADAGGAKGGVQEVPSSTQVGYRDEEAEIWREQVARKMGWKVEGNGEGEGKRREKVQGRLLRDANGVGGAAGAAGRRTGTRVGR